MNTMEILTQLRASGLTLRPSGDQLIGDSDKPLTDQQRQFIRQHKAAILRALEPLPTAANRRNMPHIASVVDAFRQVFGAEQVRVVYAEENGIRLGRLPALPTLAGHP